MYLRVVAVYLACALCNLQIAVASENPDFSSQSVITFGHSGGRLGDNLLAYLHAKWISYQTGLPLLCNYWGFHHAQEFVLYDRELNLNHIRHPAGQVNINRSYRIPQLGAEPTTFMIPYFPEASWEWEENGGMWCRFFEVDWKDPLFRQMALEMIAPKNEITLTLPPPGVISVAIHAREGGNFESPSPQHDAPLKRPPLTFYRDALRKVIELFPGRELFCQIFTDAVHPELVAEIIQEGLPDDLPITVRWRTETNNDAINVVDDFFSLFHYDVLIRPESNFSMVPSLLHDYAVLVIPKHAVNKRIGNEQVIVIDDIDISVNVTLLDRQLEHLEGG